MAQYTPNLGLIKPDGSDNVAIQQLNANMDVLDQQVHENTEKIDRTRIVYPPYIDENTGHWMIYDLDTGDYADSGYSAIGRPATFTARATTLPAGSDATASMSGTAENPVLNIGVPTGATGATGPTGAAAGFGTPTASVDGNTGTPGVTVTASGPNTAKVFDFKFRNLKGATGDPTSATAQTIKMSPTDNTTVAEAIAGAGKVASVNGQTGAVQLNDENIPSNIDGKANVEAVLSYHSQQIDQLSKNNGVSDLNRLDMRFMYYYTDTLNSPYKAGLTDGQEGMVMTSVIQNDLSGVYSSQVCMVSGGNIFTRTIRNGQFGSWAENILQEPRTLTFSDFFTFSNGITSAGSTYNQVIKLAPHIAYIHIEGFGDIGTGGFSIGTTSNKVAVLQMINCRGTENRKHHPGQLQLGPSMDATFFTDIAVTQFAAYGLIYINE